VKNKLITAAAFKTGPHHGTFHHHNGYELIFVKRGSIRITIENDTFPVKDGTLIFLGNLENHTISVESKEYERFFINLSTEECDKAVGSLELIALLKFRPDGFRHALAFASESEDICHLFSRILEEHERADLYSEDLIAQYLREILIRAKRRLPCENETDSGIRRQLYEMQSYLDLHFKEDIRIDELCTSFYANRYYLTHAFKTYTGYSPKQYLTLLRLRYAVTLFAEEGTSVCAASSACGFSDLTGFIRSFKKHYGMTPTAYKQKHGLKR
jgi:AraC-like DNA-binding protein